MGAPTDPRFLAWYGVLQAGLRSTDRIGRDLEREAGVPLAWYELLAWLGRKAEDGRMRMGELAGRLLLSPGGVTRMVARMEEAGLVTRESPAHDRRATYAVITPAGLEALARSEVVHEAAVARHFGASLTIEEAETLRDLAAKVLDGMGDECRHLTRELVAARGGSTGDD